MNLIIVVKLKSNFCFEELSSEYVIVFTVFTSVIESFSVTDFVYALNPIELL